jgi:aspartyl-tRNA(Asn)/glutamyl-tRNA(Gln) amidotransferase subunit B
MVIGLEVHLQLATRSKIFSGSATTFGAAPNTQASAVDLAMPGMLPVLNRAAVEYAVLFGLAIDAEIGRRSVFDRKNYFYPDLPKGYQISQFAEPIVGRGRFHFRLPDGTPRDIGITRAHLEEDAGKSLHEDFHGMTGIDLNRAGTPLLEIVTEPDFRSAGEAVAFLKALHSLVTYLGISDGNMAEGSMRCDINLSLRPAGSEHWARARRSRTSTPSASSKRRFTASAPARRISSTTAAASCRRRASTMRTATRRAPCAARKSPTTTAIFPEPDLLPVVLSEADIETSARPAGAARHALRALCSDYGLSAYDAGVLTDERAAIADYFEAGRRACGDAKLAANWVQGELLAR